MADNSLGSLLDAMKVNERLHQLDLVVAVPPKRVDALIAQAHVAQLGQGGGISVDGEIKIRNTTLTHTLRGYYLGAPTVDLGEAYYDTPQVRQQQSVEGGTQVISDDYDGVLGLYAHDALNSLQLRQRTRFDSDASRVSLDIKEGESDSMELDLGSDMQLRLAGGAFMKNVLKGLDKEQGKYALLGFAEQATRNPYLKVDTLGVRTHRSADDQQGALMIFAGLDKGTPVVYPPKGAIPFLLPDEMAEQAPVSMTLSSQLLHRAAFAHGLEGMLQGGGFTYQNNAVGGLRQVTATKGALASPAIEYNGVKYAFRADAFNLEASHGTVPLRAEFDADQAHLRWQAQCKVPFYYKPLTGGGWQLLNGDFAFQLSHRFNLFKPFAEEAEDSLLMGQVFWPWADEPEVSTVGGVASQLPDELQQELETFVALLLKRSLLEGLSHNLSALIPEQVLAGFSPAKGSVPAMRHSEMPHGMVLFGDLGCGADMRITDQGLRLAANGKHTFEVQPATAGVTWSLASVAGNPGAIGSIDPRSGEYLAPPAHALEGRQARVLVIASKGTQRSVVQLTVLPQCLTVNPLIYVCAPGDELTFAAGSLGAAPVWSILDQPASGHLQPSADGTRCLYRAREAEVEGTYVLDQIEVHEPDSGCTRTVHVLVKHVVPALLIEATPGAGGLQMTAYFNGEPLGEEFGLQWALPLGGPGTLDESGWYQPVENPEQRYVLVTASIESPWGMLEGHLIQPLAGL